MPTTRPSEISARDPADLPLAKPRISAQFRAPTLMPTANMPLRATHAVENRVLRSRRAVTHHIALT